MPSFDDLETLARRAKLEGVPTVSVANRVIATLADTKRTSPFAQSAATRSFALAAACAVFAAAPTALLAVYLDAVASDPWIDLLYAATGGVL